MKAVQLCLVLLGLFVSLVGGSLVELLSNASEEMIMNGTDFIKPAREEEKRLFVENNSGFLKVVSFSEVNCKDVSSVIFYSLGQCYRSGDLRSDFIKITSKVLKDSMYPVLSLYNDESCMFNTLAVETTKIVPDVCTHQQSANVVATIPSFTAPVPVAGSNVNVLISLFEKKEYCHFMKEEKAVEAMFLRSHTCLTGLNGRDMMIDYCNKKHLRLSTFRSSDLSCKGELDRVLEYEKKDLCEANDSTVDNVFSGFMNFQCYDETLTRDYLRS